MFFVVVLMVILLSRWWETEENLKQKIPELQKSIAAIQTLVAKRTTTPQEQPDEKDNNPIHIRYALCDNIYAKARLSNSTTSSSSTTESGVGQPVVYLWLGANVMLEYEYDAALMFLRNNHERAERDLSTVSSDLSFVRDQIVTAEVNMSRIFNWDVRRRRQKVNSGGGGVGNNAVTTTTTSSSLA
jgi:Prefoldin subunit